MFTDQFFNLLLNLNENWTVMDVNADHSLGEVYIQIEYTGKIVSSEETFEVYDFAPERKWRHLDILQYKTYILSRLPRYTDQQGKVKTIVPPWASKHERHSYLFEHAVIDLLKATKNQTKTAELMRCGFNVVNRILHISTQRGLGRRDLTKRKIKHLSIDEKSFKKGHNYVSVLSDPMTGFILGVEKGRTKIDTKRLFDNVLSADQQKEVQTISMDMWKAYLSVAKEKMINAEIIHDRFHLIKYLNKAIDQVRRREVKTQEELKNSRYALLKNEINLTDKQRIKFEIIRRSNYEVSRAWEVRENFKSLYNTENEKDQGISIFLMWAQASINKNIKEVSKVVDIFKSHLLGVVNALTQKYSNAMAERLNGKIQEIKLRGRGYRKFENYRSAILFFHGGLKLYPLNSW